MEKENFKEDVFQILYIFVILQWDGITLAEMLLGFQIR